MDQRLLIPEEGNRYIVRRSPLILAAAFSAALVGAAVIWNHVRPCGDCAPSAEILNAQAGGRCQQSGSCPPAREVLVAHAGGGCPDGPYSNSRAAIDTAVANGLRLIEIDFMQVGSDLLIQHDGKPPSDLTLAALLHWLDAHPDISIITDIKTDNLAGLEIIRRQAGDRLCQFIPQIYGVEQFEPARKLGFRSIILTVYRLKAGSEPVEQINALPLRAVTIPAARYELADLITHPVYLHTVNEPVKGFGLYTDFLTPFGRCDR